MICKHCGKEFSDEFDYCPYCAEPVTFMDRHPLTDEQKRELNRSVASTNRGCATVLTGIILFPVSWIVIYLWNFVDLMLNDADYYGGWNISLWSLIISISVIVIGLLYERFKSDRQKEIDVQFDGDQTSICPHCGSHNIKIYRKGYDYKVGFWGSIFGVRGSGYAGGFGANTACCRCQNCGHDWETDYDYRLIEK